MSITHIHKNDPNNHNTQKEKKLDAIYVRMFFSELNDKHIYRNNIFLSIFV